MRNDGDLDALRIVAQGPQANMSIKTLRPILSRFRQDPPNSLSRGSRRPLRHFLIFSAIESITKKPLRVGAFLCLQYQKR